MGICYSEPPVKVDAETDSTCCNQDTCDCPSSCCIINIRRNNAIEEGKEVSLAEVKGS